MKDEQFDVVVIGSGGAGLTGALASRTLGARTLLLEQADTVGGTYSYSSGLAWVPNNTQMRTLGCTDSEEEALAHVRELSGGRHNEEVLQSFVRNASRVIDWLERMQVPFEVVPGYPDYYAERRGGMREGRYVGSPVFYPEGHLDEYWREHSSSSPHYTGLVVSWPEIQQWGGLTAMASWDWAELASRVVKDGRAFGAATTGYLLAACLNAGVDVRCRWSASELVTADKRVTGVVARSLNGDGQEVRIGANWGVLLATGGYDADKGMQARWDPHPPATSIGVQSVDGSGVVMALELGAAFQVLDGQLLTPCYHIPGEEADRVPLYRIAVREPSFPGSIIVNGSGRRFCDESFYRAICHGMAEWDVVHQEYPNRIAYMVFDEEWKRRYPLGSIGPGEVPPWLVHASTPALLAEKIGVDGHEFQATIERYNQFAKAGEDPEFHRGGTEYGRNSGDASVTPTPCVRALEGELYAIEILLATVGTNNGLVYDANGQVLHVRGRPIPGLYAAGNAGANLAEGLWYNSGCSNARGMTFGYLAAQHMAELAAAPGPSDR